MSVSKHIKADTKPGVMELAKERKPSEIELGMLQMQILWILSRKSTHGYEIMKSLSALKGTKITQGTLYPTLQRLENLGLIKRKEEDRRIDYHISGKGRKIMEQACLDFTRTFFGVFQDFVCGKCVSRVKR